MKKLVIALMIALIPTIGIASSKVSEEEMKNVKVQQVVSEINAKPLPKPVLKTGDWIWIGVIAVVGITFGSLAWNSRTPL